MNNKKEYIDLFINEPYKIQEFLRDSERVRNDICPSVGKEIGGFLRFLVTLTNSQSILEIGTSLGYSTLWLASAGENVQVDTIEASPRLVEEAKRNITLAGMEKKIVFHCGFAETLLPTFDKVYDFIFIDGSTKSYAFLFDEGLKHLKTGGVMVFEDVLFPCTAKRQRQKELMDDFNHKIANDPRVEMSLLTIDDGLMLCRKL